LKQWLETMAVCAPFGQAEWLGSGLEDVLAPVVFGDDAIEAAQRHLAQLLASAGHAVGFTGAGISTECGIPDFRSAGSPWLKHRPIDFQTFVASRAMRREAWRRKFAIDDLSRGAAPGRGHRALTRLAADGRLRCVITQNIDGLHQASGLADEKIIELHGNGTYAHCLTCGRHHSLAAVRQFFERQDEAPDCEACGGIVKSATIAFGQSMPAAELRRAQEASLACDLFLVIGSSLVVYPAAALPLIAKENGASLVILNQTPTELDDRADLIIRADIGGVLEPFAREGMLTLWPR
jgi:NAD-dependent deacetylase